MFKKLVLSAAFAAMAAAAPASASVVFSDNFNGESQGLNYTAFANWTVTQGTVDMIGTGFYDFYPGNGNYVDMDGSTGASGGITTISSFGPANYLLTFDLGGSQRGDPANTVVVSFNNVILQTYTLNSSDPLASESISFTALGAGSLSFTQTNPGDNQGLILDNVVLSIVDTTPAPEPMTLSLFGAGLAAMGLRRRKKA